MSRKGVTVLGTLPLILALLFALTAPGMGQTLQLSRHADFSTTDGVFSFSDSLHARVVARQINFLDIKDNEFRLHAASGGDDVEGQLINKLDGTYEAHIPLATLSHAQSSWEFRVNIRDSGNGRFEARQNVTIREQDSGDTLSVTGKIDSLGNGFLRISGNTIFVTASTIILKDGQNLAFGDLKRNWKVTVLALRRSNQDLEALQITVIEAIENEHEIQTQGSISAVLASAIVVNNIRFQVDANTEIRDANGQPILLASLLVGMRVEVKGRQLTNGDVIADRIVVEDSSTSGREIELTGHIDFIDTTSAHQQISVDSTLFDVDTNTVILGFNNEPLHLADLQVGELVEINGRTRTNQPALALKIKREDRNGDEIEITGQITALGDSTITVAELVFRILPTSLILDHDKRIIALADLHTGLLVEVRGGFTADSTLVARLVKVEDEQEGEIELKGFIDHLDAESLTVLGVRFLVDDSTAIRDEHDMPLAFASLQVGMLVEVKGRARIDGAVVAILIQVEDFLKDEVEIRGAIQRIGENELDVAGLTFTVTAQTTIVARNDSTLSFGALQAGMIVEIRAQLVAGEWLATRIKIKDKIDSVVEISGQIDSLSADGFTVLAHHLRVTNATVFRGRQNQAISFSDLQVGDRVKVKAQLLADSSLVALKVRLKNQSDAVLEFTGSINALGFDALVVGNFTAKIDNSTLFFNSDSSAISVTDLSLGMVVEVHAVRSNGGLLAITVRVEQRRALTGSISQLIGNEVWVQGLAHEITDNSIIFDSQNQVIDATQLNTSQTVEVVGTGSASKAEVVTMRILYTATTTGVSTGSGSVPAAFTLEQNYPNPFNPSTTIRFSMPEARTVRLTIYDILGRRVRTLVDGALPAGAHQVVWDGRNDAGLLVASGSYIYRLDDGRMVRARKLTFAK